MKAQRPHSGFEIRNLIPPTSLGFRRYHWSRFALRNSISESDFQYDLLVCNGSEGRSSKFDNGLLSKTSKIRNNISRQNSNFWYDLLLSSFCTHTSSFYTFIFFNKPMILKLWIAKAFRLGSVYLDYVLGSVISFFALIR